MRMSSPTLTTLGKPILTPSSEVNLHHAYTLPYGALPREGGVQFTVFSRNATAMRLLLYSHLSERDPSLVLNFDPKQHRWGDVWSMFVPGMKPGQLYHLQAEGPNDKGKGHRFDGHLRLIDPWARALAGDFQSAHDGIIRPPKCLVVDDQFDWEGDRRPKRPLAETIIYEMHVKGFTAHRSSGVEHPGTYLGVIEKIPYLQSLGVTAVELMPAFEFPIKDIQGQWSPRPNYWGYDTMCFFSPHRGYASGREPGSQVREFKEMVKAFHQAGIEVILDVVFNHTCEGNERGPILSFKGLENSVYYILTDDKQGYKNYSGCGNTLNCNQPIVRELILECLRYWALTYHVDGFRFDLASILCRGQSGEMLGNPPLVERISQDPVLADTKLIAEAWDAAGAYQVGSFPGGRWAEWNGRYRDDMRRYWRGDPNLVGALATRLTGSSDLYQHSGRKPFHSTNFVTSHDGFTMNDLVSYNEKHNEANGEGNRDGDNHNCSYNFGVEGPTTNKAIEKVRLRQIKNLFSTLLLSLGAPMLVSGDECRRTQRGNNNAYCQDNVLSYFNWRLTRKHAGLLRFVRSLNAFRLAQPTVRLPRFLTGHPLAPGEWPDVSWYHPQGHPMRWDGGDSSLICVRPGAVDVEHPQRKPLDIMMVLHPGPQPRPFQVPNFALDRQWRLFVNTSDDSPDDIFPNLDGPDLPPAGKLMVESRTLLCYVSNGEPPRPLAESNGHGKVISGK